MVILLLAILLMAINDFLLMAIDDFLLMAIDSYFIGCYFINDYW